MAKIEKVYHVSYQSNEYMGDRWFLHKQQAQNWLNERQDEGCLDIENEDTTKPEIIFEMYCKFMYFKVGSIIS